MTNRLRISIKPHNFNRRSGTFQLEHVEMMKNGCDGFDFYNSDTGEFGFSVLPEHFETVLNRLIQNKGFNGKPYFYADCNFVTYAKPALEVSEFMTQSEIANLFKIHACRIATVMAAGWLTPTHKIGRKFQYRRTEVLALDKNADFVAWLNNQYERRERATA